MFLKSLHIHGFKSFAQRTLLEFHPGVTGIVGPNGCGKSNVVDAVRWVLGETSAKALRGGEMADVIFNGTESRKPVGMAEVTLTLADCEEALGVDYNEMSVTRRVFRDGKSEYKINGKTCRLKDINELLMDTGIGRTAYSIMEQGKIDQLLSSKPEDRRAVFEEAAGITKFKQQKKEALRKLEYTEANLLRVEDIIAEVKRQMGSVQRQAQKARRYQTVLDTVKTLDTHHSYKEYQEQKGQLSEFETNVHSLESERTALQNQVQREEHRSSNVRSGLTDLDRDIAGVAEELRDLESGEEAAQRRIAFNAERVVEFHGLVESYGEEITGMDGRLAEQQEELASADDALAKVATTVASRQSDLLAFVAAHDSLRGQRSDAENRLREAHKAISKLEQKRGGIHSQIEARGAGLASDTARVEQLQAEITIQEEEQQSLLSQQETLTHEVASSENELTARIELVQLGEADLSSAKSRRRSLRNRLNEVESDLARKSSRRDVLREMLEEGEGLDSGTQAVLNGLDAPGFDREKIEGFLSSHIEVVPEFVTPVETALGSHLEAIVVEDSTLGASILRNLSENELGTATLLARDLLDSGHDQQLLTIPEGALGWAMDKVTPDEATRGVVEVLLRDVLIVPDLETALGMRDELPGTSFVTMDGSFLGSEGILRGGNSPTGASSLLRRENELRDLDEETERLTGERTRISNQLEAADNRITETNRFHDLVVEALREVRVAHGQFEGHLDLAKREAQQASRKVTSANQELATLRERHGNSEETIRGLSEELEAREAELVTLRESLPRVEEETNSLAAKANESGEELAELKTALAVEERANEALAGQRAPIARRMAELQQLIAKRHEEIETYQQRITEAANEDRRLEEEIAESAERTIALRESKERLLENRQARSTEISKLDGSLQEVRRRIAQLGEQSNKEELSRSKIEIKVDNLRETMRRRYNVELDTFEPDPYTLLACLEEQRKASKRWKTTGVQLEQDPEPEEGAEETAEENQSEEVVAETMTEEEQEQAEGNAALRMAEILAEPDWEFIETAVNELRRRLDSIGSVNLDAIEEYRELEERHDFLESQYTDLVNSKEELLRVIAKINRTTREMFESTFAQVRENFRSTFKELFGDRGKADLMLMEDEDPLEAGIEIIAKPPGKKLQSISLLSGGERSMTAVALLFSIYMVKPSPFCVLDELDAPLDDSNIGRFLKMLDKFIDKSQFVIVTHNKRTMHRADVIYGVTMEEYGVSKTVGMRFSGNDENNDETQMGHKDEPDPAPAGV